MHKVLKSFSRVLSAQVGRRQPQVSPSLPVKGFNMVGILEKGCPEALQCPKGAIRDSKVNPSQTGMGTGRIRFEVDGGRSAVERHIDIATFKVCISGVDEGSGVVCQFFLCCDWY